MADTALACLSRIHLGFGKISTTADGDPPGINSDTFRHRIGAVLMVSDFPVGDTASWVNIQMAHLRWKEPESTKRGCVSIEQ